MPRDLIFDLDDTLIESFPSYVQLHTRIAVELGWRIPSRHELVEYGPTWQATLVRMWPDHDLAPFMARYDQLADDLPYRSVPGAVAALHRLRAQGHRLWVVTKRERLRLAQRLRQAELPIALFEGVFCNEDVPEPKPSPRCFEPIADALGRAPSRPVYVGDRDDDRMAAQSAGIEFVAVCTGPERSMGFPYEHPVSHVLPSVTSLPAWLREA
ncbi:HAD family hydrolase [Paraliomyxa miuraensis]|uniref:HAD family hydrolase n=1 Tax=Paraliomyxa miuraensis TaxID=376150 RepID=UPI00225313D7|nr:HAD hydrolase-like protein [Paraliomyxa miuraensis]MCX4245025.1 HAD family hydrolase [Paraliomyxa miuraensis]